MIPNRWGLRGVEKREGEGEKALVELMRALYYREKQILNQKKFFIFPYNTKWIVPLLYPLFFSGSKIFSSTFQKFLR